MIKTEALKLFSIYSLLLLSKIHSSISPSLTGFIDLAHESATGITDSHDAGAVKSTIELAGERAPHSQPQPCRRNLRGCFGGLFRGSETTARTSQAGIRGSEPAEGTRATSTFARTRSWTFSISTTFRRIQSKLLFGFYPKTRENWNLAHASYEEILASAIRSKSGWGDDGTLAANLADLRTARRQSTEGLGLNPDVRRFILKTEIPKLHQDLVTSLDKVFRRLLRDEGSRASSSRVAIINKFFKVELQDPELAPLLEPFKSQLDRLNALRPTSESAVIPETLSSAQLPLKPSFSNLGKLKIEPEPAVSTQQFWPKMSYQFGAEASHLRYLARVQRPVLPQWAAVERLTEQFRTETEGAAWVGRTLYPEKFTISSYRKLKEMSAARRSVIQEATRATQASYYRELRLDHSELLVRRKIALEALLIESYGERSDEVREIVQRFVVGETSTAQPYLRQILSFNSPGMNLASSPSTPLLHLREAQHLPRRPGPVASPSVTRPSTPPSTPPATSPPATLGLEYDVVPPIRDHASIPDVSYVEGSDFDQRSRAAERAYAQSLLEARIRGH